MLSNLSINLNNETFWTLTSECCTILHLKLYINSYNLIVVTLVLLIEYTLRIQYKQRISLEITILTNRFIKYYEF